MIDTAFDVYSDTPTGKDPDQHSRTLRSYHAKLWSKPLPDGREMALSTSHKGAYLYCKIGEHEHYFSSDSICHTYRRSKPVSGVISQISDEELDTFYKAASTVGAYIIFPGLMIDRKPTINGARGMHPKIGDRFDLTLECIRLHYEGQANPLSEVFCRNQSFFDLFSDFEGYTKFFLLDDLVDQKDCKIKFFIPADSFKRRPYPNSVDEYLEYRRAVMEFIDMRNKRITRAYGDCN